MKKKQVTMQYYSLKRILEYNALYNVIFGERSNGKTYACLEYGLERWIKQGQQFAIIRRWLDDFKSLGGNNLFDNLVNNGVISRLTKGEWTNVLFYSKRWYLYRRDEKGNMIKQDTPFAYAFAITAGEHYKSTSYPKIRTIIFDEFLTNKSYLPNEFIMFTNLLSTIIRERDTVKIFMLGNTVNKYSPYFNEMGLTHVKNMKMGSIDLYHYGESKLTVAVEYTEPNVKGKPSDVYFAFNNPKLQMITTGAWEIGIYPHCPIKYAPKDIKFFFFIEFDHDLLQCEIVKKDKNNFLYIHRKTTPLHDKERDHLYTTNYSPNPRHRRRLTHATDDVSKKIANYFVNDKVFYQDNEVGEIVRNYIQWCDS